MTSPTDVATPDVGGSRLEAIIGRIGLVAGPIAVVAVWVATAGLPPAQRAVAATAVLMGVWWMCESLPMWLTACLPFVVFPLVSWWDAHAALAPWWSPVTYVWNPLILLFVGGMLLARGMENTELHRRIALHVIRLVGHTPRRLVLGVMCAGALLSMFVSNTATALMLFPIARALAQRAASDPVQRRALGGAAMLGLAYGCNAGGAACLIGSPPNLIFVGAYGKAFGPDAPAIGFVQWWTAGLPFLVAFLPIAWWYLTRVVFRVPAGTPEGGATPAAELRALGPPDRRQWMVFGIFTVTAALWITRDWWDAWTGPHWGLSGTRADGAVALAAAVACVVLPRLTRVGPGILEPRDARRLPWGILVLLAGGMALSRGFEDSALTGVIGQWVSGASGWSPLALVAVTALAAVALTALTSNTGTAGIVAPILVSVAPTLGIDPRLLILPAALGVSCDFALPVGTPPNAIAYSAGEVSLGRMARAGLVMDVVATVLVVAAVWLCARPVLGIAAGLPGWAAGG